MLPPTNQFLKIHEIRPKIEKKLTRGGPHCSVPVQVTAHASRPVGFEPVASSSRTLLYHCTSHSFVFILHFGSPHIILNQA
jgi:hypothetical protein